MTGNPDFIRAKYFAEIAHFGQTYNDEVPYTYHLDKVHEVAVRFGVRDIVILCATLLHDTIEDSRRSYNDIKEKFGVDVAELVFAVTNEVGRDRKERSIKTYPKIAGNKKAIILKLSDRIANVEYGIANGSTQSKMYAKEYPEFRGALYLEHVGENSDIIKNMWDHLDRLLMYKGKE